jgi:ribonucleoside-diphosphate reductase alpha chain
VNAPLLQDPGADFLSKIVGLRTYQRFALDLGRRETRDEALCRAADYFEERVPALVEDPELRAEWGNARRELVSLGALPAMRLLAQARLGVHEPTEVPNDLIFYNCMTQVADRPGFLWQTLIVAGSGCGVGLSVEKSIRRHGKRTPILSNMPAVKRVSSNPSALEARVYIEYPENMRRQDTFVVEDSLEGWGRAVQVATWLAWSGHDRKEFFDYSALRAKGEPLRRRGGYSSGPDPLRELIAAIYAVCGGARGRKLRSTEVHYLYTLVGEAIVCGGVRRMAAIDTGDLRDRGMRDYKDWLYPGGARRPTPRAGHVSNNSAAVHAPGRTSEHDLRNELEHTFWSLNGERGLWCTNGITEEHLRPNACGEVCNDWTPANNARFFVDGYKKNYDDGGAGLFCNLSAGVARATDTWETFAAKVRAATLLGTLQASMVEFSILPPGWRKLAIKQAQIGVDLTGQTDAPHLFEDEGRLVELREEMEQYNEWLARRIGINPAKRAFLIKPGGNSAAFAGCSSGAHARHSRWSIQRMEISTDHPLFLAVQASAPALLVAKPGSAKRVQVFKDGACVYDGSLFDMYADHKDAVNGRQHPDAPYKFFEDESTAQTFLFEVPLEAPEGSLLREHESALDQMARYRKLARTWVAGPKAQAISITVTYEPHEVPELIEEVVDGWKAGVWKGLTFLPYSPDVYFRAPREEVDEKSFREHQERFLAAVDKIDWAEYERLDNERSNSIADGECSGKACELKHLG